MWLLLLLAAIELTYAFYFTAGRFRDPPLYNNYYDLLAEGFRAGQLHLAELPDPRLVAKADPHDFKNSALWKGDVTLYAGKYYLYWGPVPALLQAIAKSVLRIKGIIGDQYLTFSFLSGAAILGALLLDRITRRLFDNVPLWLTALGVATFAFANPVIYLVSTSGVYQAAITGGQVFALAGLFFAFDAVWQSADRSPARWRLVLSGLSFALALGCRISLGPCISVLVAITALTTSWRSEARLRSMLRNGLYQGTPVALGLLALLLYNKLRFDRWLEFGTNYQLTFMPLRVSSAYVLANLYSYMLAPFELSCRFPYVLQSWLSGPKALPGWLSTPAGYWTGEPISGFLRAVPITWLLPFALVAALNYGLLLRRAPLAHTQRVSDVDRRRVGFLWCAASFAVLGTASGWVILGFYFPTMRYLGDITFGLVALSLLGGYSLFAHAPSAQSRIISAGLLSCLAGSTIVLGLLLGYQGYNDQFTLFNPKLDSEIVQALSVCQK